MKEQHTFIRMIALSQIIPDPEQPRKVLRGVERMSRSLAEEGQFNPILVRALDLEQYQIIDGEQRYWAAVGLDWMEMACIIVDLPTVGSIRQAQFHSNFFRDDLDPFELAHEFKGVMERRQLTEVQLADLTDLSRSTVSSILGLVKVPHAVRERLSSVCQSIAREKIFLVARATTAEEMDHVVDQILAGESITQIRETRQAKKREAKAIKSTKLTKISKPECVKVKTTSSSILPPANEQALFERNEISSEQETTVGPPVSVVEHVDVSMVEEAPHTPLSENIVAPEVTQLISMEPCTPTVASLTTEERLVQHWWQAYTCHAIRVGDLKAIFRETAFAKYDIARLLEKMHGTVVAGYMIVSVPTVQDKRVHQLIPIDLVRPDYLTDLTARLAECNAKLKKEKHV